MKLAVAGAGIFGTAMGNALKKENEILLYTRNENVVKEINETRKNTRCFPNKILSKKIKATNNLSEIREADILFICIPSYAVVSFIEELQPRKETLLVNGAKGFGKDNLFIPEAIGEIADNKVISLKGPSFANEMIFELPTAFTVASPEQKDYDLLKSLFRKDLIVLDYSPYIRGIEVLSVVKNVYAIIIGIVDASYNSSNVRFLAFTKALLEIRALLGFLELPEHIMFSYAGLGDFGLTALNDLSRNRTLGLLIGKGFWGKNLQGNIVLEGINAIGHILQLLPDYRQEKLPLLTHLNELLKGNLTTKDFVNGVIYG